MDAHSLETFAIVIVVKHIFQPKVFLVFFSITIARITPLRFSNYRERMERRIKLRRSKSLKLSLLRAHLFELCHLVCEARLPYKHRAQDRWRKDLGTHVRQPL